MRIKRIFWSGLFSLALIVSPFIAKPSFALTFDPSFGVTLASNTPSANSSVTITATQPEGDEVFKSVKFIIPAGWNFASGSSFAQDAVMGTGTFSHTLPGFGTITSTLTIKNDLNTMGHKTHWKLIFSISGYPDIVLDSFGDGDISTGYIFTVGRTMLLPIGAPANLTVTLNGMVDTIPVLTNPTIQGDYTWGAEYTSPSSVVVTKSQTLSIPGTVTPTGTNVTASFNNGSSVTFSDVSIGGVTTIASSTNPPPEGTGQFQLSGGLYYDFNTTATTACPCTVTIPYDPVATTDPKIYHLEGGIWVDSTTFVDTVNHTVTGVVSSFSFFAPGQPNNTAEWLSPVKAFKDQGDQLFNLNQNQALPLNLIVKDSNGNVFQPLGLKVELRATGSTTSTPVTSVSPVLSEEGEHLKAKINLKDWGLTTGEYFLRVIIEGTNTTLAPDVHFTIS